MIIINPKRTEHLIHTLTEVWEQSVRASHFFLTEKDIAHLVPFVKTGIAEIPFLIVAQQDDEPIGFMGINKEKIEMLSISPVYFGKGLGGKLIKMALNRYHVKYVDVNEQNLHAVGFYNYWGFEIFERKETDDQGNPFPLLRMKLK